jgi:hypothetical protein
MGNGILDQINNVDVINYKKLTPEMISDVLNDMGKTITGIGDDYVTYTGTIEYNHLAKIMERRHLVDTLKNL